MNTVRPEVLNGGELELQLPVAESEVGPNQVMPYGVIGSLHGV